MPAHTHIANPGSRSARGEALSTQIPSKTLDP